MGSREVTDDFASKSDWLRSSSYVMFMLRKLPLSWIRKFLIQTRIQLFSSVTFKMPTINKFFSQFFGSYFP